MGGAVTGATYGTYPSQSLGQADDEGNEGRWIPTASVDQYGATIAKWLGLATPNMEVFPNLTNFAVKDWGFMKPA
jgi:hypothetical protein